MIKKLKSFNIGDLKISLPIIQGGMGVGVSLSGLASAVANEGGVGVISCAGLGLIYREKSKDYFAASILGLKEEIRAAREKSKGVIGVNIMVALSDFSDMVKTSIAEKVDIIFSGAGLALDLPSFRDKMTKTKLVPIVSSSRAFKVLCEKWKKNYDYLPDAVVVEGPKAGGHLGYKTEQIFDQEFSLEKILPEVVKCAAEFEAMYGQHIPVIAAGGIYSGEDVYTMMNLGAEGFQLGTRFVTTDECDANIAFKQQYINSREEDIEIIASPVGMPGRAIKDDFIRSAAEGLRRPKQCTYHCIRTCDYTKSPYCIMLALYNAAQGRLSHGYAFAGVNAYLSKEIISVKETIKSLKKEFKNRQKKVSSDTRD